MSKTKSQRFKLLEGNRSRREVVKEPMPRPVFPGRCPYNLGNYGRLFYKRMARKLSKLGLLKELDGYSLELLARSYQCTRECDEVLRADGLVIPDARGSKKKHPLCAVRKDAVATFIKLSEKFGLTPYDRHGMVIREPEEDAEDLLSY